MFRFVSDIIEGALGVAVNTVKLPLGVVAIPFDDGDTLADAVEGITDNLKKIGNDKKEG